MSTFLQYGVGYLSGQNLAQRQTPKCVNKPSFLSKGAFTITLCQIYFLLIIQHDEINVIPTEVIEKAYKVYAWVVKTYGDKYLPTFIRMHEELEKRKHREHMKQIATKVADETDYQFGFL